MTPDLETNLNTLIAKCEYAIRRGDIPHLEILHTLQQQLVTAHDARQQSQTEVDLRTAIEFYYQHIPASERTTTFAALTEQIEQIETYLDADDGQDHRRAVDSTPE